MSLQWTVPLLYISVAALCLLLHTCNTLNNNNPHLSFFPHSYTPYASCAYFLSHHFAFSACRVLCLFIMETLQLLCLFMPSVHHHWVSSSNSFASPSVEISSSSVLVELNYSVVVIGSNIHPAINCVHKQSLFYWQIPRDSSTSMSIMPKCLRVLFLKQSVVSSSYTGRSNISPPIMPKFTCIIGLAPWDLVFISAFWSSSFRDHRGGGF